MKHEKRKKEGEQSDRHHQEITIELHDAETRHCSNSNVTYPENIKFPPLLLDHLLEKMTSPPFRNELCFKLPNSRVFICRMLGAVLLVPHKKFSCRLPDPRWPGVLAQNPTANENQELSTLAVLHPNEVESCPRALQRSRILHTFAGLPALVT